MSQLLYLIPVASDRILRPIFKKNIHWILFDTFKCVRLHSNNMKLYVPLNQYSFQKCLWYNIRKSEYRGQQNVILIKLNHCMSRRRYAVLIVTEFSIFLSFKVFYCETIKKSFLCLRISFVIAHLDSYYRYLEIFYITCMF